MSTRVELSSRRFSSLHYIILSVPLFVIFVWCHVGNECLWERSLAFWKMRDEMVWKDEVPDIPTYASIYSMAAVYPFLYLYPNCKPKWECLLTQKILAHWLPKVDSYCDMRWDLSNKWDLCKQPKKLLPILPAVWIYRSKRSQCQLSLPVTWRVRVVGENHCRLMGYPC